MLSTSLNKTFPCFGCHLIFEVQHLIAQCFHTHEKIYCRYKNKTFTSFIPLEFYFVSPEFSCGSNIGHDTIFTKRSTVLLYDVPLVVVSMSYEFPFCVVRSGQVRSGQSV